MSSVCHLPKSWQRSYFFSSFLRSWLACPVVLVYNLDTLSIFVYIPPQGCAPEKAVITFKGTIGGFGLVADSNLDSDLELPFGYRVQKNVYAYLGYRARYEQCRG
jgi:hypothetical protein